MAAPLILDLPYRYPTLWDEILESLNLASVKNLRLTSKALAAGCIHPRFIRAIAHQTIELTAESVESLASLASHPLGAAVKSLTVTAVVYDASYMEQRLDQLYANPGTLPVALRQLDWMDMQRKRRDPAPVEENALVNSLAGSLRAFGKLDTVELNAAVVDRHMGDRMSTTHAGEVSAICEHANHCYLAVIAALESSGVVIGSLSLFQDTPRGGLELDSLAEHMTAPSWGVGYQGVMTSITNFAVGIAVEDTNPMTPVGNGSGPWPDGTPLAWVLDCMPNLKTLDIRFFSRDSEPRMTTRIFSDIARQVRLRHLTTFRLRGAKPVEPARLVQFLQAHSSIHQLDLEEISLLSDLHPHHIGTHREPGDPSPHRVNNWASLIPFMAGILPCLNKLRLSSLVEIGGTDDLFNLYPIWATFIPALRNQTQNDDQSYFFDHGRLVHTIVFEGDQLKRDLVFFTHRLTRTVDSPFRKRFMEWRQLQYGPAPNQPPLNPWRPLYHFVPQGE
ncbi:hypothetical protein B0T19DRAFT_240991 [Cercophora scortea]|uniref:Uncharacterized protein n=1 Tax=Cercophora scortea TaxID=314031 RepID=A0AAE0I8J6_9PEZI|nr:hypothetical protein B0T19DRAFT_240991 [Cercophora scortea]